MLNLNASAFKSTAARREQLEITDRSDFFWLLRLAKRSESRKVDSDARLGPTPGVSGQDRSKSSIMFGGSVGPNVAG